MAAAVRGETAGPQAAAIVIVCRETSAREILTLELTKRYGADYQIAVCDGPAEMDARIRDLEAAGLPVALVIGGVGAQDPGGIEVPWITCTNMLTSLLPIPRAGADRSLRRYSPSAYTGKPPPAEAPARRGSLPSSPLRSRRSWPPRTSRWPRWPPPAASSPSWSQSLTGSAPAATSQLTRGQTADPTGLTRTWGHPRAVALCQDHLFTSTSLTT